MVLRLKLISGIVVGLLLVVSMSAFAASAEQENAVQEARAKVLAAQKELLAAQVEAGILTQEQADRITAWLDARQKQLQGLSKKQEQTPAEAYRLGLDALKDRINALVEAGRITPERGSFLIKILEAHAEYKEAVGFEQKQPGRIYQRVAPRGRGFGMQFGNLPRMQIRQGRPFAAPGVSMPMFGVGRAHTLPRIGIMQQLPGLRQKRMEDMNNTTPFGGRRRFVPGVPFEGSYRFGIQAPTPSVPTNKK